MPNRKKRVLICDDDPGILGVIKIILEQNGYNVMTVNTGKSIQKVIKKYDPDILFLDIWMPGIDGKEITKILKRDAQTKGLPIVVVSALSDTQKIAEEAGADDFLAKPFNMDSLLSIVKKHTR